MLQAVVEELFLLMHNQFQWAPTLVGECYWNTCRRPMKLCESFNGHPPLWVNATNGTGLLI